MITFRSLDTPPSRVLFMFAGCIAEGGQRAMLTEISKQRATYHTTGLKHETQSTELC